MSIDPKNEILLDPSDLHLQTSQQSLAKCRDVHASPSSILLKRARETNKGVITIAEDLCRSEVIVN